MSDTPRGKKLGDYLYDCQQCGRQCWYSQTYKLTTYTGKGNIRVCSDCKDSIDYGLIPYKIKPERAVPESNNTHGDNIISKYLPVDQSLWDPLEVTPIQLLRPKSPSGGGGGAGIPWDQLNQQTWDQWTLPWGN